MFICDWRSFLYLIIKCMPLLLSGLFVPVAYANLHCTLQAVRSECTALPAIRKATLRISAANFAINAQYEACHSIRHVQIKGRALQTISAGNIQEYELLGETYRPVTDFIPFPRTIGYLVLDTSNGNGTFTDTWSAQRLPRYSTPALLTVSISCRE